MKGILFLTLTVLSAVNAAELGSLTRAVNNKLYAKYICATKEDGFRAIVPGSCSQYYECSNGKRTIKTCANFFSSSVNDCVDENPGCIEDTAVVLAFAECDGPCCGKAGGYAVSASDPAVYYKCCDNQVSQTFNCSGDQHFNLATLECDLPSQCNNGTCGSKTKTKTATGSNDDTTTASSTTDITTTVSTTPIATTIIPVETTTNLYSKYLCRDKPDGYQAIVPGSCSKYYECENNTSIVKICPKYYSLANQSCVDVNPGCIDMKSTRLLITQVTTEMTTVPTNSENTSTISAKSTCTPSTTTKCSSNDVNKTTEPTPTTSGTATKTTATTTTCIPTTTKCTKVTTTKDDKTTTECSTTVSTKTKCTKISTTTSSEATNTATTTVSSKKRSTACTKSTIALITQVKSEMTTVPTNSENTSTTSASITTKCTKISTTNSIPETTTKSDESSEATNTATTTVSSNQGSTACTKSTTTQKNDCTASTTTTKAPCTDSQDSSIVDIVLPKVNSASSMELYYKYACQNKNDGFTFASLTKCNAYYVCIQEQGIEVSCGQKYYNAVKQMCDLPENTGCIQSAIQLS